jgi:hypothetical protein
MDVKAGLIAHVLFEPLDSVFTEIDRGALISVQRC